MQYHQSSSTQSVKPFNYLDYSWYEGASSKTILTKQPILLIQNPTEYYKGRNVHMEKCMFRIICASQANKLAGSVVRLAISVTLVNE